MLSDHLGTPRQVSDGAQRLRWRWDPQDPFGANTPNQNPQGLGGFAYNLRFPGQYFDAESGLHYNYFRDFDPRLGRYVESDPIGLKGALNTFAYVRNNPIRYTDPKGLEAALPFPATGAVGGAAAGALGTALGVLDGLIDPGPVGEGSDVVPPMEANFPPGYWPGDKGADEWGRRSGCGAREGRRRFHDIKKDDNISKPTDKYGVNPSTGDIIDPEGEVIGNLGNE